METIHKHHVKIHISVTDLPDVTSMLPAQTWLCHSFCPGVFYQNWTSFAIGPKSLGVLLDLYSSKGSPNLQSYQFPCSTSWIQRIIIDSLFRICAHMNLWAHGPIAFHSWYFWLRLELQAFGWHLQHPSRGGMNPFAAPRWLRRSTMSCGSLLLPSEALRWWLPAGPSWGRCQ